MQRGVHTVIKMDVDQEAASFALTPQQIIEKFMEEVFPVSDQDCVICMEQLSRPSTYKMPPSEKGVTSILPNSVGRLIKCGHILHRLCMLTMYINGPLDGSLQCPFCKKIYGIKTGTQPKGTMEVLKICRSLPGHPDCHTIKIIYTIFPGIQGPEHPSPGKRYICEGFPRYCYLPDNQKGNKVLNLLKVAWNRRLIFTVGTPYVPGGLETVFWNGITHKTSIRTNIHGEGYPDPVYLDKVLSELAAFGITEEDLLSPL